MEVYLNDCYCFVLGSIFGQGQLVPNPKTFPSGIKALANYVHGKGLKA